MKNRQNELYVRPNAKPKQTQLAVKWADDEIGDDGQNSNFSTPHGMKENGSITAYQPGSKRGVNLLQKDKHLRFDIKNYTHIQELIIDPHLTLTWATYYGGAGEDMGNFINQAVTPLIRYCKP